MAKNLKKYYRFALDKFSFYSAILLNYLDA